MRLHRVVLPWIVAFSLFRPAPWPTSLLAQDADPLKTPIPEEILRMLADEVSGQDAFNNMVKLAGAPWLRTPEELTGESNFYESEELYRMATAYGIETVRLDRYDAPGTFEYPLAGELWVDGVRLARIPADPALVASGSQTGEAEGPLVYVPQLPDDQIPVLQMAMAAAPDQYRGAIALMWTHPRGGLFEALDQAGVKAVISFSSRERYLDPDQVVYSRGGYADGENLRLGMTVSWRQWSELLEDVQSGGQLTAKVSAVVEEYPDRFETVYAWIPGTEPELPGVVYTGHLFEGYTKRGANDDMGGPAIQLEILRALHDLIQEGKLPRPRRTLHFIWPNEISGTYEFLKRDPELLDRLAININMDMVSEALRKNNGLFTMSETPPYLASFYDGLARSVLSYVWRTNDIVYLPDSPRGRPGGQYFPRPLWEKNGSRDAFRFFIHEATGGSDHIVFNNPSVGIPGIEFFTWPDQWYHADKDTPENGDPTEMRRVAFIGAATGWASANLSDEMLPGLLDAVSGFGYARVAERGIPRALALLETAGRPGGDDAQLAQALNMVAAAVQREQDAVHSIRDIYTGTPEAEDMVAREMARWTEYGEALRGFILDAASPGIGGPAEAPAPAPEEPGYGRDVPRLAPGIRGQEFNLGGFDRMQAFLEGNPRAVQDLGLSRNQTTQILNFVNGERSVLAIRNGVAAWTGEELTTGQVADYLKILEEVGWVAMDRAPAPTPQENSPVATFSIVGLDPATGEIGVAVQSRVFSVGNGVVWGEAGVGVVATQAWVDVSYGPKGIALLRQGLSPQEVVDRILEEDPDPLGEAWPKEGRQFSVMDAEGNVATYTGPLASEWAGHRIGKFCSAQGNILAGPAVVDDMVTAFQETEGHLSYRLLAALEAGQAAGGDTRGMQSAAMLIVKEDGGVWLNNDVVLRLQVDDAPEPIAELRRLVDIAARQRARR
jgi:aminopeptidase YwaD